MGRGFPIIRKIADGLRALWHYLNTSEPTIGTAKNQSLEQNAENLAKAKAIFEFRELERNDRPLSRIARNLGGAAATITALASLLISAYSLKIATDTANSQQLKTKSELDAAADKQFDDLIQSAADSNRGPGERIASIWSLRRSLKPTSPQTSSLPAQSKERVFVNSLCFIIANDSNCSVMSACASAVENVYKEDGKLVGNLLFGSTGSGEAGSAVLALKFAFEDSNKDVKDARPDRVRYLCKIFEEAKRKLESVHLEEVNLARADLRGAYLAGVHLERADLEEANLEGADLEGAYLEGTNLQKTRLLHANLAGAHVIDLRDVTVAIGHPKGDPIADPPEGGSETVER